MRNFTFLLFLPLILFSCATQKPTTTNPTQITYDSFRESQQNFLSQSGNIKYIDKGQGQVIVLLHGVPTSGWLYRNMIDELAKTHRVIVPDMLGYGSSDSPKGYEIYSEENHAKRILELMNSLKIQTWTHVMHDAGGLWTWELMKQDPKRVNKLVILNTVIFESGFNPPIRFNKGLMARTAMWAYRNGLTTNLMLNNLFNSGMKENTLNKRDIEGYKKPLKEGKTNGMYYFFTQTCNTLPNYTTTLESSNIPATVIWGENDEFLLWKPQQQHIISALNISEENIHLLDAKHFIQEEKPFEIVEIILRF